MVDIFLYSYAYFLVRANQLPTHRHGSIGFSFRCFERFFKYVNTKEGILSKKRNGTYVLESTQLIGVDYLWKVSGVISISMLFACSVSSKLFESSRELTRNERILVSLKGMHFTHQDRRNVSLTYVVQSHLILLFPCK